MKKLRKISAVTLSLSLCFLAGCGTPSYDGFQFPPSKQSTLKPLTTGGYYIERNYDGVEPTVEKTESTVSSADGICVIEKKKSYYDVTLDCENSTPSQRGAAYAEAILKMCPTYKTDLDGYIFDLTEMLMIKEDMYDDVTLGMNVLKSSLDTDYREELEAFAEKMSGGVHGIKKDGKLSFEEAAVASMVPDLLRITACSAITANGNKTESGHRIAVRVLEWDLGSKNQLSKFHSVVHFKNYDSSFTSIGLLGTLNVVTGVNCHGLMVGELDVGSAHSAKFQVEGKTCFSYDLRKIMETYTNAKDAAEFIAGRSSVHTYNVNIYLADDKDAFDIEDVVSKEDGKTVIRDGNTELLDGLTWKDPDILCLVNSFVTKGNADKITEDKDNLVRWRKYESLFTSETEKLSVTRVKELMASEKIIDSSLINIRSEGVVHLIVTDFATHKIQAIFGGEEATDEPEWIDLGKLY